MSPTPVSDRRPIGVRAHPAARKLAAFLARRGISPNLISLGGLLSGIVAGGLLAATPSLSAPRLAWGAAALFIALRLLANMLDGMVAVEHGRASPLGELFNEAPDRLADVVILVGAGFAQGSSIHLGYWAALLALSTAYVRALGNLMGVQGLFLGPQAKPHRMWLLTALLLYLALAPAGWQPEGLLRGGLWVICLGSALTLVRRLRRIVQEKSA